ncbi:MAG: hypothetical protein JNL60_08550 [Bacteroidia bacterium]|nr:hypothetical protein [Bacteroidia bacterium]
MSSIELQSKSKSSPVLVSVLANLLFVLLLFFIDEGNFNFDWAYNWGGWFAFGVYFTGILLCQCLTYLFILRKYKGEYKNTFTSVIGIPLGLALVICLFLTM